MIDLRRGDLDAFHAVPRAAYGPGTRHVSPLRGELARTLDPALNPTFGPGEIEWWTAHRDGRPVGRITAHVHRASNARHGLSRASFGFFDCADDPEAAEALLGRAEAFARARGLREVAGNFNLTAMQQIGVVTDGFDRDPFVDQVYSPPHVHRLLEGAGYGRFFPMTTFVTDLRRADPEAMIGPRQRALLRDPGFAWAPITRRAIKPRLEEARVILNDSFAGNPMFVPLSREEYLFQARDLRWVIDPRISAVLGHRGEPVAATICIPDVNPLLRAMGSRVGWTAPWHYLRHRTTNRRVVLIYTGVVSRMRGRGVGALLMHRVASAARRAGYAELGGTWIADANEASLRQRRRMGGRPLHRLHLYRKALA